MRALFFVQLFLVTLASFGVNNPSASAMAVDPKIESCFAKAAKTHEVPIDLLKTIAQMETQGTHIIPQHEHLVRDGKGDSHMVVFGIMGLRNDSVLGTSLLEGAQLLGKSPEELKADPCLNIAAAAAILAAHKSQPLRGQPSDYLPGLMKLFNYKSVREAKRVLEEVNFYLENGFLGAHLRIQANKFLAKNLKTSLNAQLAVFPTPIVSSSGGEFPGSEWNKSSNYGEDGLRQRYIIIHTTEGGFEGSSNWLRSSQSGVSSHYLVRSRDGFTEQLVREKDQAFHARCWNPLAFGIEMEGFLGNPESFTVALYDKVAKLVKYLAHKYKIKTDNLHIVGHNFGETKWIDKTELENCNDHGDPGKFFNWPRFFNLINLPAPATPNSPPPTVPPTAPPTAPPPPTTPPETIPPGKIPPWDFGNN